VKARPIGFRQSYGEQRRMQASFHEERRTPTLDAICLAAAIVTFAIFAIPMLWAVANGRIG